ncbi:MAG: hypothetical protein ACPG51_21195, partial [Thiolinea sp.]
MAEKMAGLSRSNRVTLFRIPCQCVSPIDLGRLLALQKTFDLVNFGNAGKEPYLSWVKEHEEAKRIFLDEISGQWLVPSKDYWTLA